MKFSDGYWRVREGFDVQHPAHVTEVSADERSLTVLAPTGVIASRGETLNRPTATITLSSPATDVIKVRIEHHAGGREPSPQFALPGADDAAVSIEITDDAAQLTSGHLTARVHRGPGWQLDILGEDSTGEKRVLTSSGPKTIGLATGPDGAPYVFQQLALDVGEKVYGLGERFGPVAKNGQPVDIWNADGGTSSEQAYKNVPFFWTTRGYGVFVNHPEQVSFEIGSEAVSRNQFSVPRPIPRILRRPRPDTQADPGAVHRADRPATPGAGLVLRSLALDVIHHRLRREDRQQLHRRHGRARHPFVRLSFRLLLDA